jgi:3-methyladenine DNA glycosylase/8-oxoguanine DNA glycosylase
MARARKQREPWAEAIAHLRRADPYCAAVIDRVGPCLLEPKADRFSTLVRAIIGQQISSKAAASIDRRLREIGGEPHDPAVLLELGEAALRGVGLSGVKARYVLNLSEAVASGHAPLGEFHEWDDDAIVARLTAIKGIGRWTAEMFLIFALNRPDVLPVGDLGIRAAIRDRYGLPELPRPGECAPLVEHLRPYRTIAMWYFWRDSGNSQPVVASSIPPGPATDSERP